MKYSINSIFIVRSYFEEYEQITWKIIGLFTDKKKAEETAKKWEDFYIEKYNIFNEPKNWKPETKPDNYPFIYDDSWINSEEYSNRIKYYDEIFNFKEIIIEEFDINKDLSIDNTNINEELLSMMKQWDRNYKIEKIIK